MSAARWQGSPVTSHMQDEKRRALAAHDSPAGIPDGAFPKAPSIPL
jgi:hypothetical protein